MLIYILLFKQTLLQKIQQFIIPIDNMAWQYGWNAQSALRLQQKKFIKVSDKGIDQLKGLLKNMKQQKNDQKNINSIKTQKDLKQKRQIRKNNGIQSRIKSDQYSLQVLNFATEKSYQSIRQKLQQKSKIYNFNQKNAKNNANYLTDFISKQLSKQDKQFQQMKKDFYSGRLDDVIKQQARVSQQTASCLNDNVRENLHFQRQALQEINGTFIPRKNNVAQGYDKKHTEQEKAALTKIIAEKKKIQQLNQKKELQQLARLRKLRKLNILDDDQ